MAIISIEQINVYMDQILNRQSQIKTSSFTKETVN